jgi:hypothetical protein
MDSDEALLRLENKLGPALKAGQDRRGCVKKHAVSEISTRMCHNHRARRPIRCPHTDQPAALSKLLE